MNRKYISCQTTLTLKGQVMTTQRQKKTILGLNLISHVVVLRADELQALSGADFEGGVDRRELVADQEHGAPEGDSKQLVSSQLVGTN